MSKQTRALTADEQSIVLAALYSFHQRWEQRDHNRGYAHRIHKVMDLIEPGSTVTIRRVQHEHIDTIQPQQGKPNTSEAERQRIGQRIE